MQDSKIASIKSSPVELRIPACLPPPLRLGPKQLCISEHQV